jgi:hypothetical protein
MAKTTTDLTKANSTNDYDNGAAYINPNSLKIPPTTVQKLSGETDKDLAASSGVLMERFNDYDYYTA